MKSIKNVFQCERNFSSHVFGLTTRQIEITLRALVRCRPSSDHPVWNCWLSTSPFVCFIFQHQLLANIDRAMRANNVFTFFSGLARSSAGDIIKAEFKLQFHHYEAFFVLVSRFYFAKNAAKNEIIRSRRWSQLMPIENLSLVDFLF